MSLKLHTITKERNFKEIAKKGRAVRNGEITLKILKNENEYNSFGIVISTKVSKLATKRNQLKRRIKEIIRDDLKNQKIGYKVMILISPKVLEKEYSEIKESILGLFNKAGLYD